MITNEQMESNRYGKVYYARKVHREITEALTFGGYVVIATMTKVTKYTNKHAGMFKVIDHKVYVQSGKHWYPIVQHGAALVGIRTCKPAFVAQH